MKRRKTLAVAAARNPADTGPRALTARGLAAASAALLLQAPS